MRIWTISDLHLEVEGLIRPLDIPDADVCVVAGDLTRPLRAGVSWLAEHVLPSMPCVYVPGNHEYYGSSINEGFDQGVAAAREHPGLHLLNDAAAEIGGVRFLGSTLWTDYRLMGDRELAMAQARHAMNDHRRISLRVQPWERFLPQHASRLHAASRSFLSDALSVPFDGPTVVVTHHCPHPSSVHESYRGDIINAAFASDLTPIIERGRPALWIHGHTHHSFDYRVAGTRVLCNPRGYGSENAAFDRRLVVDVGAEASPRAYNC